MNSKEILKFCMQNGLLIDRDVLKLFSEVSDVESVKLVIEKIKINTGQNFITRNLVDENRAQLGRAFETLPEESQRILETLKIKLGLNIEISREVSRESIKQKPLEEFSDVKVLTQHVVKGKKIEVKDFITFFKNRFNDMKDILQERAELDNLVSINKLSENSYGVSVIGIVTSKNVTKNKNIIFEIEDITGKTKVLVNNNKPDLVEIAEEISLDSVIGFKGSGNKDIIFVNEIIFPESALPERKKSFVDESVLFIGDLHFGSKRFMRKNFLKFIEYLNSEDEEAKKVRYLFLVGDIVTGVGNYPNQEVDLEIKNLEEQFSSLAEILGMIRKDIKIIISPGNHDGVRLMEPQPMIDEKYAWPIYDLDNVIMTENPATVNIGAKGGFSGINVLAYHGFSFFYYVNTIPFLMKMKAANTPEVIMKYLLKNRHLAPTQGSTQYFPLEKDGLLIRDIPDIFVSGHTHKSGVSYYNNILVISISTWEEMTPYMEKVGSQPDFCKVPMFNLKTREVKILDFE